MQQQVTEDVEDLHKKFKGPGELKEIFKRLLSAGKKCSCRGQNCFNYVNAPPETVLNSMDESMQYCGLARIDTPADRCVSVAAMMYTSCLIYVLHFVCFIRYYSCVVACFTQIFMCSHFFRFEQFVLEVRAPLEQYRQRGDAKQDGSRVKHLLTWLQYKLSESRSKSSLEASKWTGKYDIVTMTYGRISVCKLVFGALLGIATAQNQ